MESSRKNVLLSSVIILFVAISLRMTYLYQYEQTVYFQAPLLDSAYFIQAAQHLSAGEFLPKDYSFNPLYPIYLAMVWKLTGEAAFMPRLIQSILGSISALLIFFIGRREFNKYVGLIAGLSVALYQPLIYFDAVLMATTLVTISLLVMVFLALKARDTESILYSIVSGLFLGIAVLGRPNFILILPVVLAWFLTRPEQKSRSKWTLSTGFLTGCVLILSPVIITLSMQHHRFVFVAPHGGINFYLGNHASAPGSYTTLQGISHAPGQQIEDSVNIASQLSGHPLSPGEASTFWYRESFRFIRNNPLAYLRLMIRKTALFWNHYELPSEYSIDFDRKIIPFLRVPLMQLTLVSPLALMGLLLVIVSCREKPLSLWVFLTIFGAVILFFVHSRYRLPATPLLCLLSAYSIWWFAEMARLRLVSHLAVAGALLAALAALTSLPMTPRNNQPGYYNLARAYYLTGNYSEAERNLTQILADSDSASVREFLGRIYLETHRYKDAVTQLQQAVMMDPELIPAHTNLGIAYFYAGEPERSIEILLNISKTSPGNFDAVFNLGAIFANTGQFTLAEEYFRKALACNPPASTAERIHQLLTQLDQLKNFKD